MGKVGLLWQVNSGLRLVSSHQQPVMGQVSILQRKRWRTIAGEKQEAEKPTLRHQAFVVDKMVVYSALLSADQAIVAIFLVGSGLHTQMLVDARRLMYQPDVMVAWKVVLATVRLEWQQG